MTHSNVISQVSAGTTALSNTGHFSGVAPTASGQIFQSTAPNAFAYNSSYVALGQGGVIQYNLFQASAFAGQGLSVTQSGGTTTSYNGSAKVSAATITPLYANSTIYCLFNMSVNLTLPAVTTNAVAFCGYQTPSGPPIMSAYVGDFNTSSGLLCQGAAAVQIANSWPATTIMTFCAYRGLTTNVPLCIYDNDYIVLIEQSAYPVSPTSVVVSSGAATLCLSFPVPVNSSISIQGQFTAFNTATDSNGNGGRFSVVGVRGSGNVSFSGGNYYLTTILTSAVPPYMYILANTATQAIEIYGVGINSQTFLFNFIFTTN